MALTRQQKEGLVQDVAGHVSEALASVFVAFDGITLEDMTALRDELYAAGCKMQVVPKRLLKLALQKSDLPYDPTGEDGQIALVWGTDPVAPAKILHGFAKKHADNMRLASGVLEGGVLSSEEVLALAKLPSREQLLGQLVSVLAGPMRGFAGVLSGVPRSYVYVLQAIVDSK